MTTSTLKKRLLIGGALALVLLIGAGVYLASSTWGEFNRVVIDRPEADGGAGAVASEEPGSPAPDPDDEDVVEQFSGLEVVLLVGSDSRDDLDDLEGFGDFDGNRADVVMVLLKDGRNTGLLSLPRDLLVEDSCVGHQVRLADMLQGCGDVVNGPTLLTVTVEEIIGKPVNHFALVDLDGFRSAVDAIGGYEICVDRPVRDRRAHLELPAGCTLADGDQTLAWLRSRRTQELTDNGWRIMPGVNDLSRNERQRQFMIDMMGRIANFRSPQSMTQTAQALAPFVTVDSELSLVEAVNLAWTLRGVGSGSVTELVVPVHDVTGDTGAALLMPSTPVDEVVAEFLSAATDRRGDAVLRLSSR
jgi:LCP family protein required for cell wall assembly